MKYIIILLLLIAFTKLGINFTPKLTSYMRFHYCLYWIVVELVTQKHATQIPWIKNFLKRSAIWCRRCRFFSRKDKEPGGLVGAKIHSGQRSNSRLFKLERIAALSLSLFGADRRIIIIIINPDAHFCSPPVRCAYLLRPVLPASCAALFGPALQSASI